MVSLPPALSTDGVDELAGIFERMLPYASKYELRIIAVNTRSHGGSTPYTDDELAEFASSDVEIQTSAVRKFGREVGSFMVFACTSLGIPAVTVLDGQKRGGLAFLTWSLSNMGLLSILGDPKTLDDAQKTVLQRYLRTAFAYGAYSLFACYPQCLSLEPPRWAVYGVRAISRSGHIFSSPFTSHTRRRQAKGVHGMGLSILH